MLFSFVRRKHTAAYAPLVTSRRESHEVSDSSTRTDRSGHTATDWRGGGSELSLVRSGRSYIVLTRSLNKGP